MGNPVLETVLKLSFVFLIVLLVVIGGALIINKLIKKARPEKERPDLPIFKKLFRILSAVIFIAVLAVAIRYLSGIVYRANHPIISIIRMDISNSERFSGEPYHDERIMAVTSTSWFTPKKVRDELNEFSKWYHDVDNELYNNYVAPYDIRVFGEVKDGKTTIRFEGYVTTPDGETVDYKNERTFDIEFSDKSDLFN